MNLLALAIAVGVSFASGFVWFGPKGFYPAWIKAMGITPKYDGNMAVVFGLTFFGIVSQTAAIGWIVGLQQQIASVSLWDGAGIGLLAGLGLCAATSLGHRLFAGHGIKTWLIEVGNDVLNLTIAGAIFAALG